MLVRLSSLVNKRFGGTGAVEDIRKLSTHLLNFAQLFHCLLVVSEITLGPNQKDLKKGVNYVKLEDVLPVLHSGHHFWLLLSKHF